MFEFLFNTIELTYFQLWIIGATLMMSLCILVWIISPKPLAKGASIVLISMLVFWPISFPLLLILSPIIRKQAAK